MNSYQKEGNEINFIWKQSKEYKFEKESHLKKLKKIFFKKFKPPNFELLMGNIHIKDFFNNQDNVGKQAAYIQHFFNSGLLQHNQFLSDQWIMMNIEKSKEGSNFFDWNNVPASSLSHDQVEEKLKIQEFKENLLIGQLPKNAIEDLLNPSFYDEAQSIYSPSNVVSFKDHQNHIFLLLYHYFYLVQNKRKSEVHLHISFFYNIFLSII